MKITYLKNTAALLTIILFTGNLIAKENPEKQKKMYVSFYGGYGFKMGSQNILGFHNSHWSNGVGTHEQIDMSLGKGFNFGGAFGYMFNQNIGAELGVSYLLGDKTTAISTSQNFGNWGTFSSRDENSLSAKMLRINPSFIIASGFEKKFNPYAKFGLIVGFGSIMRGGDRVMYHSNGDEMRVETETKYDGGVALGVSSGVGVVYTMGKKISLFGECNIINLSYAPAKGVRTKYIHNGEDQLPQMTTRQKETKYVSKRSFNQTEPIPPTEPSIELKQKYPFGSIGINIGVRVGL